MKKILAVLLCVATLACTFAGCAKISQNADNKGDEIPVYMSSAIYTLDPAYAYTDEAACQILGLLYEGLYELDAKGKPVKALCTDVKSGTNRDGDFYIEYTIAETKWSDGRSVSANDFVFAWKRLLQPEFSSEAASLLYDIKNAKECKAGLCSIDDVGIAAAETNVLQVVFDHEIKADDFAAVLTSPALVPLREDKVGRLKNWASNYATMVTDGPFYAKIFTPGDDTLILERSIYYYRDMDSETQKLDVYVKPYRLVFNFVDAATAYEKYNAGEIVIDANLPISDRATDIGTVSDTLSTATYYFNVQNPLFAKSEVRQALSLAIDREELVNDYLVYAKPATGLIPTGVYNTTSGTDFRREGGDILSTTADIDGAKALLKQAGVTGGSFTIKIREGDEVDELTALYAQQQWSALGFEVEIVKLDCKHYEDLEYDQYQDELNEALYSGDFDVIAVDITSTVAQPFAALACFARGFSGNSVDLSSIANVETTDLPIRGDYPPEAVADPADSSEDTTAAPADAEPETNEQGEPVETTAPETTETETEVETTTRASTQNFDDAVGYTSAHITGYENSDYTALIEKAYEEHDLAKRAEILHEAETMILGDMPVMPLFVYQHAYVKSKDLKDIKTTFYGFVDFQKASLSNANKYKEIIENQ